VYAVGRRRLGMRCDEEARVSERSCVDSNNYQLYRPILPEQGHVRPALVRGQSNRGTGQSRGFRLPRRLPGRSPICHFFSITSTSIRIVPASRICHTAIASVTIVNGSIATSAARTPYCIQGEMHRVMPLPGIIHNSTETCQLHKSFSYTSCTRPCILEGINAP
jgi:hypothetical protein